MTDRPMTTPTPPEIAAALTGIPVETIRALMEGRAVAVPREATIHEIAAMEMELSHILANVSYRMPWDGMRRVRAAMLAATEAGSHD